MNPGFFAKQLSNLRRRDGTLSLILVFALAFGAVVKAQVINLPVGIPVGTSGAGNARTDADNFFIRNNVAGMTEIPLRNQNGKQDLSAEGHWRFNGSLQLATYLFRRERFLPGPTQGITTETRFGTPPVLASEITYTRGDRKFAIGLGAYTIFGFQSKLKDPPALGPLATFFDTRVASNDFAVGGAARLHRKLSVGGSFILGRGFIDLARPNPTLAQLGIARQDRLDVAKFGAPGASVGLLYRPTERLGFGINYKTKRSYNLEGSLETFAVGPPGAAQVIPVKTPVTVKLKPPAIAEGGFEIKAADKLRLFADFRFYDYTATFQELVVRDKKRGQALVTLKLDAFDVRSFRAGGLYALNRATILQFGLAHTNKGFPDAAISPGTVNTGGFDFSVGVIRRTMGDLWLNISVAGIPAQERKIGPPANPLFPGKYGGWGGMLGVGMRW